MRETRISAQVKSAGTLAHSFAHLHVRSGFSYGYGTATPEELVEAAAGAGYGALALTDKNGLYGVARFLKASSEAGISPMVGAEVSIGIGGCPAGHVVLLVESMDGYVSLCRLITRYRCASEDRRRPLCPLGVLLEHTRGLVCLSGAIPFGLVPHLLSPHPQDTVPHDKPRRVLSLLREAFGPRNLYVELTDDRTAGARRRMRRVEALAGEVGLSPGIPTLATGEVAYLSPGDHRVHEVLVATSHLSPLPGPAYRPTDRLHLSSREELARLFRDRPEALRNARSVAERCAGAVRLDGELHLPQAILPAGEDPGRKLLSLTLRGAKDKYRGTGEDPARIKKKLRREISCIASLGFVGYFLIAHEAVSIAKEKGVPVTGRGSAANSIVAYCLDLTQPEPLSNRLLFERFLHEGRRDPPDIDLDFCSERRDEVRDELIRRYEGRGAAVAATANTLSLRGAVRVAARALGRAPREIDGLSRNVPRGAEKSWEEVFAEPAMRGHPLAEELREGNGLLLDLAGRLSGRLWQAGTHLGGLVIGTENHPLSDLVPLEPSGRPGLLRAQLDKDDLEYCGWPKLDLLGLKMHTALSKAGALATRRTGRRVDPLAPPPEDKKTYSRIRSGKNAGVFQLESPGQMALSRRLRPRRARDLCAQVALFRPGPVRGDLVTPYVLRKNGEEPYSVPLPDLLEDVLGPTYGVLLFQEQVIETATRVGGFTLAEGDLLRRAMTRERGPGAMRGLRAGFLKRARERGVPRHKAEEVFSWMEGFAIYGFSAAHAASFAHLSYASAYMRVHYPAEFFASVLNSQPMGFYSPRVVLNEARRAGLVVLPPEVHRSGSGFTVEDGGRALRVGLRYCKGISQAAISSILEAREKRSFVSPGGLYRRTPTDRGQLENLIVAGFLDPMGERSALLRAAAALPEKSRRGGRKAQPELPLPQPADLWEAASSTIHTLPPKTSPLLAEREAGERRILGLDVRAHPLARHRGALADLGVVSSEELLGLPDGTRARVAGLVEALQSPPTRGGAPVWFVLIEDEAGLIQATVFKDAYHKFGHVLYETNAYLLEGRIEQSPRRGFSFLVERIADLEDALAASHRSSPAPRRAAS